MDGALEVDDERDAAIAVAKTKRKKAIRCNDLSVKYLRSQGYLVEVVEKRLPGCMITKDLYGFIDILAVKRGEVLGVQATSHQHVGERITKIANHENVGAVREAGIRIVVHGWKKSKTGEHTLRVEDIS
jgi:hypothetical protein